MKKILYMASLALTFAFAGCDDFLTVESPDFSTEIYWRDKSDVEAGLSAVYGQLENRTSNYGFAEHKYPVEAFRGDDVTIGDDINNYPDMKDLYEYTYTNENATTKEYWMNNYNGINYANNVIFGIDKVQTSGEKMSDEDYNHLMGEAVFLRAYYHFKLILNWEDIIIRDEYLTSEEQVHKAISPRIDCWDFICTELEKAANLLPETRPSTETGRVTKDVAYAYLGWSYLTRAYEETDKKDTYLSQAIAAFNNVKHAALEPNFESMFNGTNKNCQESIFELQFTNITSDRAYHKHVMHYWVAAPSMGGWDEIRVSPMMYNEFLKEGKIANNNTQYDARAYASMIFDDAYYAADNSIFGEYNYADCFPSGSKTAYCFKKLMPSTYEEFAQSSVYTNVPLMRYANVMLMKAEALNEQGTEAGRTEAINLINEIRNVHGKLPPMKGNSYDAVKAQIEHERLVEFSMECYRFYDLRRWGKLEEAMKTDDRSNFNISEDQFLPIPLMESQSNNDVN